MIAVGPDYGFGLYIHWPYCARICPYCDFNVYAAKHRDAEPLLDAIIQDIRAARSKLSAHPKLDSVFFGGGTPSLLTGQQIERLLRVADDTFGLHPGAEITLEANPNDLLATVPGALADAGINRLSIGVQSLDDAALQFLGRDHKSSDALKAIERIQSVFNNYSIDLIYARPGQTLDAWSDELARALGLGAPHLSLYELTIEERTAFGKRAVRGDLTPMADDDQADLYELTQDICEAHGLPAYEVSNHARSGAYQSRHNHIYWASGDWIGVGPGAHGRLTIDGIRYATEATRRPQDYIENASPQAVALSSQDTAHEFLAMALRSVSGLDRRRFANLFDREIDPHQVEALIANGQAQIEEDLVKLTAQGRLIADYAASVLAPY